MHGVAFAGLLLAYDQFATQDEGVGRGVEIHLISSVRVSNQLETDQLETNQLETDQLEVGKVIKEKASQSATEETTTESTALSIQEKYAEDMLTSLIAPQVVAEPTEVEQEVLSQQALEQQSVLLEAGLSESVEHVAQSTNASQQQHTILELLHRRISDNKQYPYLARRQRREGVATVAFELHPDGKIENTRLVTSSHASALDRAALTAVKHIEPFTVAHEYLEQAETFQVDIEFELL